MKGGFVGQSVETQESFSPYQYLTPEERIRLKRDMRAHIIIEHAAAEEELNNPLVQTFHLQKDLAKYFPGGLMKRLEFFRGFYIRGFIGKEDRKSGKPLTTVQSVLGGGHELTYGEEVTAKKEALNPLQLRRLERLKYLFEKGKIGKGDISASKQDTLNAVVDSLAGQLELI